MGAYFSIHSPASLIISHLSFDFSDSLVKWDSSCCAARAPSCSLSLVESTHSLSVESPSQDCDCSHPLRYVDSCFFHHPLSLINSLPSLSPSQEPKTVTLSKMKFTHIYTFYNSLIGFDSASQPVDLIIKDSLFSHISMCGSLLSSAHSLPYNPQSEYSTIQHAFTTVSSS